MGKKEEASDLVYELKNHVITSSGYVETNVPFLASGFSGTILFDIDIQANPSSGDGRIMQLIRVSQDEGAAILFVIIKSPVTATKFTAKNGVAGTSFELVDIGVARYKFAVTHEAYGRNIVVWASKDGETPITVTVTSDVDFSSNKNVMFGYSSAPAKLPRSIINDARIYNRVLSNTEINTFFA